MEETEIAQRPNNINEVRIFYKQIMKAPKTDKEYGILQDSSSLFIIR
jgi:hypothetical protein